ncbi:MAG: Coq4 family protein [Myxococcota bacterium]|nr:Coq4 family protein [Myxococcota bacterium]
MSSALDAPARPARDWIHGLKSLWRFVTTPSDLANSFDAMLSLAGPTVEREFRRFAEHPTGARMLAERPRRDLNALLGDRAALATMPAGSFAAAYLEYLGGEEMGSAEHFLEAAQLEEKAPRLGWSDDHLWFVSRMANSHDLFHIVGGYGRDIVGEVGVVCFTAGQIPLLPLKLLLPYFAVLRPSQPIHWLRYLRESFVHGRETPSLACVDYEALLPLPLEEARRRIGAVPWALAHPGGTPAAGWLMQRIERRVTLV